MMKRALCCLLLLATPFLFGCGAVGAVVAPTLTTTPVPQGIIQYKNCARSPVNGFIMPCTFDNPVLRGDLIVVVGIGGCNPLLKLPDGSPSPSACDSISDSQGNAWKTAVIVPNNNGNPLWYALNAKGGSDTISFAPNTGWEDIIAEYPPSTGFEAGSFGTYTFQNTDQPGGSSNDIGWTTPIETTEPCELLIAWGISEATPNPNGIPWEPSPGPYFTVRTSEYGGLALEDSTTEIPGLYIASMKWNVYAHWDLGLAAFKMGGCK